MIRLLKYDELAEQLGWTASKIRWISDNTSWGDMHLGDAEAFAGACGVNLMRLATNTRSESLRFWQRSLKERVPMKHLERRRFGELVIKLRELKAVNPNHPVFEQASKEP